MEISSPLPTFDTVIIGGGMVGMSLAVALAREGMRIAVVEKGSLPVQLEPSFDGRSTAVALGSKNIFEAMGVWQAMAAEAQPILDIRVSDGDAPFFLHYDHTEVGSKPFGFIVENRYIRHALHNAAKNYPNITLYENSALEGFEADNAGCTVRLKGGLSLRCQLVVGADGKQSQLRSLAGIKTLEWAYKQTAIVCTIVHENPHHGVAQERFLPAGPFAVLPMTHHRSSLVWVEPAERVGLYMELPEEEFVQEIAERTGDYLGAISVSGKRFAYPLSLMHAKTYIAPRLALIGDAAHAIHPLAGQGVNLGFRDVAVLTEVMSERFKLGLDIGGEEVLRHYQQWRRFDNITMLAVTDGLNRLFNLEMVPVRLARGLGMWAVGKIPPLKKFFMRHAMGLSGDVPRMTRSE